MRRPTVDVVVPFAGSGVELAALRRRIAALRLASGDSIVVVDNRRAGTTTLDGAAPVVPAAGERSSYFARNHGAARGAAEWLLFLDADVEAPADLIDRYFEPAPAPATAVLAGAVRDRAPGAGDPAVVRYAHRRQPMSQEVTLALGRWAFAQTANCAVRRCAFEAVGGFREGIRSGGDADLCFRLAASGWELERRPEAAVVHDSRRTLRALLGQRARHGAGTAWLEGAYPGFSPPGRWPGMALYTARGARRAVGALRAGDREEALAATLDTGCGWAFRLGRTLPNRPPR